MDPEQYEAQARERSWRGGRRDAQAAGFQPDPALEALDVVRQDLPHVWATLPAAERQRLGPYLKARDAAAVGDQDMNQLLRRSRSQAQRPPDPQARARDAVLAAAKLRGFHDPADAVKLLDLDDDVALDGSDADYAVAKLAARKPNLLNPADMNAALRGAAGLIRAAPPDEAPPAPEPTRPTGSADQGAGRGTAGTPPPDPNDWLRGAHDRLRIRRGSE